MLKLLADLFQTLAEEQFSQQKLELPKLHTEAKLMDLVDAMGQLPYMKCQHWINHAPAYTATCCHDLEYTC